MTKHSVSDMLLRIAEVAREGGRPAPVVETDYISAQIIASMLCSEVCCSLHDLRYGQGAHLFTYDGVGVSVRKIPAKDLFREHFGVLAEIWSE